MLRAAFPAVRRFELLDFEALDFEALDFEVLDLEVLDLEVLDLTGRREAAGFPIGFFGATMAGIPSVFLANECEHNRFLCWSGWELHRGSGVNNSSRGVLCGRSVQ
jgi:hypothetical protein